MRKNKNKIAQIVPALRLKRNLHYFDYYVPKELEKRIKVGQVVEIPFRKRLIKGIIFKLIEENYQTQVELKFIIKIIDPLPYLASWQLELMRFMADYYFVSMGTILKMLIPDIPKRKSLKAKLIEIKFEKTKAEKLDVKPVLGIQKPLLLRYYNEKNKIAAYLGLIEEIIKQNKQVAIICPQFSNLYKIIKFLDDYRSITSLFLNDLPKNKYWQEWQKIKKGDIKIIIGTRSAIFAPFANLGLIIIDEEDNENHKQEEPNPRYNVKNVALKLSRLLNCQIIFSALTPSLNSLYKVERKDWQMWEIDKPEKLPEIKIINRQDEFRKGNYSPLSEELLQKITENLIKGKKIFLFLNKKGYASAVSCQDCGYLALCPNCQLPLTYYKSNRLHCHHCSFKQDLFLFCPQCHSPEIKIKGTGLEKVETEFKKHFPTAKVFKIDKETGSINKINDFDIILGTQFAIDYIDWKSIDLIGIINADTLFYLPDYRNLEKTFNLIAKIVLLLGDKDKKLLIQTFTPENYVFTVFKSGNFLNFYQKELKERETLKYPPFVKLIKLIFQSPYFKSGENEINKIYNDIKLKVDFNKKIIINPPLLAHIQQVRGRFRWLIIIKLLSSEIDFDFLKGISEDIIIDVDPENLL